MSNAASLLLRLELEGQPKGISLKDRWREVAQMYATKMQDSGNNIFYDWHAQVSLRIISAAAAAAAAACT